MPPNFNDMSSQPGAVNFVDPSKENGLAGVGSTSDNTGLKVVRSTTTLVAHILIGIITGVCLMFSFRNGTTNIGATNVHVILCVIGFQFLMAEAILCLAPDSWLSTLSLKHKRWVHTVMQVVGSVLAIAGCIHKALDKNINWNTLHGQFGLVAMVFTTVSIVNGVASLYAYEVRRILPGILSKLTHICFGAVALVTASVSLAYGFDKGFFRNWATSRFTDTLIIMTGAFTTICIINPFITFYKKLSASINN